MTDLHDAATPTSALPGASTSKLPAKDSKRPTAKRIAKAKPEVETSVTAAKATNASKPAKAVKTPAKPTTKRAAGKAATSAVKPAAVAKPAPIAESKGKPKLVRDSFTMPRSDYEQIAHLKQRTLGLQRATKKSEMLRAGLHALIAMSDKQLLSILNGLTPIKAGRPKGNGKGA